MLNLCRTLIRGGLVAVAGAFVLAVSATAANASASSCHNFSATNFRSCIYVFGVGLRVGSINGYIAMLPNRVITGHTQITINGKHAYNSGTRTYRTSLSSRVYLTQSWAPNRNYPNNTKICAKFWTQDFGGWFNVGTACVKVHK